jgi:hypothetical protein
MHANPERVSDYPAQTVDGKSYPAVEYCGNCGTFIVLFDPATDLPAVGPVQRLKAAPEDTVA